jgi:hypothetical protein
MKYIKLFERFKTQLKNNEEFIQSGDTETAPVVVPSTPTTTPRPWRPVPTTVPRPGTEEKPIGTFDEVMNTFFTELDKIKDTPRGQEIIKNLKSKYGNF